MDNTTPDRTLRDMPNWRYLLQEYDELFRYLPAGGSDRIKGHQPCAEEKCRRAAATAR
ncbi:MAG: hypothetical protein WBG95_15775 [Sulfitobacter sp.]